MKEKEKYEMAEKRARDIKGFYIHLAVYCAVIAILTVVNFVIMRIGGYTFYWFLFPLGGWGFGLFWHAMAVFVFEKKNMMEALSEGHD